MGNSSSLNEILQTKYSKLNTSIETNTSKALTNSTSIELPQEIKELISGSDFWVKAKTNRYKKLIREGHIEKLLQLAKMARDKNNPANWFAKVCSKVAWERTLAYFAKLAEVRQKAENVAQRIGTEVNKFIYKQIWKGVLVERWAVKAQETKHDKPNQSRVKYFAWLCTHEKLILSNEAH